MLPHGGEVAGEPRTVFTRRAVCIRRRGFQYVKRRHRAQAAQRVCQHRARNVTAALRGQALQKPGNACLAAGSRSAQAVGCTKVEQPHVGLPVLDQRDIAPRPAACTAARRSVRLREGRAVHEEVAVRTLRQQGREQGPCVHLAQPGAVHVHANALHLLEEVAGEHAL